MNTSDQIPIPPALPWQKFPQSKPMNAGGPCWVTNGKPGAACLLCWWTGEGFMAHGMDGRTMYHVGTVAAFVELDTTCPAEVTE